MDKLHLYAGISGFIRKNVVMFVAMVAAVVTCFFIPPDRAETSSGAGVFSIKSIVAQDREKCKHYLKSRPFYFFARCDRIFR